jgi:hypothetical protein
VVYIWDAEIFFSGQQGMEALTKSFVNPFPARDPPFAEVLVEPGRTPEDNKAKPPDYRCT